MSYKNDSIAVWRAKVKQDAQWDATNARLNLGAAHENSIDLVTAYETHLSVVPYWVETLDGTGWEFGVARLFIGHENPDDPYDSLEEPRKTIESSDGVGVALTFAGAESVVVSVPPFATQNFNGFSGSIEALSCGTSEVIDFELSGVVDTDYYSKWNAVDTMIDIPEWVYAFRVHLSRVSFGGTDTTGTYRGIALFQYMENPQWSAADGALTDLTWVSPWIVRDANRLEGVQLVVRHDATDDIDVTFDIFVEFLIGISERIGA